METFFYDIHFVPFPSCLKCVNMKQSGSLSGDIMRGARTKMDCKLVIRNGSVCKPMTRIRYTDPSKARLLFIENAH